MYTQNCFQECVAFLWESSLQDTQQSLWKSFAFIKFLYFMCVYIYIAIPSKEGDVSGRKCSVTSWNSHLNKNNIPCRKSSIILKRSSLIRSCTLRDHCIPWEQCGMPLSKFPWKRYNIVLQGKDAILFYSFGDTPCLEKNGPCESGRLNGGTVQQAGKTGTACLDTPPP